MTCAQCGKPLPQIAVHHGDDYCSSVCAKTAHGVALVGSAAPMGRPKRFGEKPKAA